MPNTASTPIPSPPESTPPERRPFPLFHSAGTTPRAEANVSLQSSTWSIAPVSQGVSRAQVVRSTTGRPRWISSVKPARRMTGAVSQ